MDSLLTLSAATLELSFIGNECLFYGISAQDGKVMVDDADDNDDDDDDDDELSGFLLGLVT